MRLLVPLIILTLQGLAFAEKEVIGIQVRGGVLSISGGETHFHPNQDVLARGGGGGTFDTLGRPSGFKFNEFESKINYNSDGSIKIEELYSGNTLSTRTIAYSGEGITKSQEVRVQGSGAQTVTETNTKSFTYTPSGQISTESQINVLGFPSGKTISSEMHKSWVYNGSNGTPSYQVTIYVGNDGKALRQTDTFEFSPTGSLTKTIFNDNPSTVETQTTLDKEGNMTQERITVTDAAGNIFKTLNTMSYSAIGPKSTDNPKGYVITQFTSTDPLGRTESRKYNALGLVTWARDHSGATVDYTYVGRRLTKLVSTLPNGKTASTSYTYGSTTPGVPPISVTRTDYAGNTITDTLSANNTEQIKVTEANGSETIYGYDNTGRLTSGKTPDGLQFNAESSGGVRITGGDNFPNANYMMRIQGQ